MDYGLWTIDYGLSTMDPHCYSYKKDRKLPVVMFSTSAVGTLHERPGLIVEY